MTDVVARERPSAAPSVRLSRKRCAHCAMPVRGTPATCWSCGLHPGPPAVPEAALFPDPAVARADRRLARPALLAGACLVLVLAVVLGWVIVAPGDGGQGARGIAARLHGPSWSRSTLLGASAEFPASPVRRAVPNGPGLPRGGQSLVATAPGLRIELLVADVSVADAFPDGVSVTEQLVAGVATASRGRVVQHRDIVISGSSGLDVVIDGADGQVRVRALVRGPTAYLMAVTGPPDAFARFTRSFHTR